MAWKTVTGIIQVEEETGTIRVLINGESTFIGNISLEAARSVGNTILGDVDFNGNQGLNVANPTENGHIANKQYADQRETNSKNYADMVATDVLRYAGTWDASTGTYPTSGTGTSGAVRRGDSYDISVAGEIDGKEYEVGDQLRAKVANPGQTAANWGSGQVNTQQATETKVGIARIATGEEARERLSDQLMMTPAKTSILILDEKKYKVYQSNPIGITEVSFLMDAPGQVNELLIAGGNGAKLKIGQTGSYPSGVQTFPFPYGAGDRVFVRFNYDSSFYASCNIKLKCKDY